MAARTGITHYAWPGGLAMVIETPARAEAAVWRAEGWRIGPADEVFARPPSGAEVTHLSLPESLADELATLRLVGSSLHTDFIYLDRLVGTLAAEGTDAALFVLGRAPAALVLRGDQVTVVEPAPSAHEPVEEVLTGADGWIVVGLGTVNISRSQPARAAPPPAPPVTDGARAASPTRPPKSSAPPSPVPVRPAPASPAGSQTGRDSPAAPPPAPVSPPAAAPSADQAAAPAAAFGRFAGDARFVLAHDAARRTTSEVSARLAAAAGDAVPASLALFDGAHTLMQISAATGLGPVAVAAIVEILLAHRLVFRYVSRVRPPTNASASE